MRKIRWIKRAVKKSNRQAGERDRNKSKCDTQELLHCSGAKGHNLDSILIDTFLQTFMIQVKRKIQWAHCEKHLKDSWHILLLKLEKWFYLLCAAQSIESCGSLIPFDRCKSQANLHGVLFNIWLLLYLPLLFLIDLIDLGWYVFIVKFLCKGFNYVIYFCSPDDILLIILLIILLLLNIYVSRQVTISWVRFHPCLKKRLSTETFSFLHLEHYDTRMTFTELWSFTWMQNTKHQLFLLSRCHHCYS